MSRQQDRLSPLEFDPAKLGPRIELVEEPDRPAVPAPLVTSKPARRSRLFARLLLVGGGVFLIGLLGNEAFSLLQSLYERSAILGIGLATALGMAMTGLAGLAFGEARSLARLQRVDTLRADALPLIDSRIHGRSDDLLARLEALYGDRPDVAPHLGRFRDRCSDALDDGERLRLFGTLVLAPIDTTANAAVRRAARDIGALTALSPLGLLDGLLVLARTSAMLREVAMIYGLRPGALASLRLFRLAIRNVVAAGIGELVSDAAVETASASILAAFSARAGQGIVNGVLAARLGLAAMHVCRPLPFAAHEIPSVRQLRRDLFES